MYRFIGLSVYRLPIDIRRAPKPFGFGARFLFFVFTVVLFRLLSASAGKIYLLPLEKARRKG